MTVLDQLNSSDQPAFVSNCNGRIVDWNEGAERLLGYAGSDMIGRHCFEVLDGKDVFGNRFCHERCAIRCMIRRDERINSWQLSYRTATSDRVEVSVAAVVINGRTPADSLVVHWLRPARDTDAEFAPQVAVRKGGRSRLDNPIDTDISPGALTTREYEVLRLLATGSTTAEIVCLLCISADTVRTHIRNILTKLNVHSRLEAVCTAKRMDLL